jgi:surfeit locus 1 family protein
LRRIVLTSVLVVVAATCFGLGVWQLQRLAGRRAARELAVAGRILPPIELTAGAPTLLANRRAVVTGELDAPREFVLRNRVFRGVPAVLIVTPLRLPGYDSAVLVNRGYVPAADASDPGNANWSEATPKTFRGVLLEVPNRGDGAPLVRGGRETWRGLDREAMRARLPYPLSSVYLVAEADSMEGSAHTASGKVYPFRADPPRMDSGPHLMYAVQWFGIAAAVVAFGVVFVLRRA